MVLRRWWPFWSIERCTTGFPGLLFFGENLHWKKRAIKQASLIFQKAFIWPLKAYQKILVTIYPRKQFFLLYCLKKGAEMME